MIDIEAAESGDSHDESDRSDESEVLPEHDFPQFARLPFELRQHIWEQFCPELSCKTVLEFRLARNTRPGVPWSVGESASLSHQTLAARTLLSVHRESRDLALKSLPDTLALAEGSATVRFNSERDVVLLSGDSSIDLRVQEPITIPGFCENIRHVALDEMLYDLFRLRRVGTRGSLHTALPQPPGRIRLR